jgi:CRISPR-associated protein Csx10
MEYNISITTISNLLLSNGEGAVLIDSDIAFTRQYFPYFPGKRLKGLLRESMREVLEIKYPTMPETQITETIYSFFGRSGATSNTGMLTIDNIYLDDWKSIKNDLNAFALNFTTNNGNELSECILNNFTTTINQTSVNDQGTALKHSLRTYRVLKNGVTFCGKLISKCYLSPEDLNLFQLTACNVRYAGLRRNRGFGQIKIIIS